jgi:hypothetical protein
MLTFTNFGKHAATGALALKPAKSAVYRFIFFNTYLSHIVFPPSVCHARMEPTEAKLLRKRPGPWDIPASGFRALRRRGRTLPDII